MEGWPESTAKVEGQRSVITNGSGHRGKLAAKHCLGGDMTS